MADVEDRHWWYRSTRELLAQVLAPHLRAGVRVLDAGCGTGATGAWMIERGVDLVATDVEPLALELWQARHPGTGLAAADVQALPFADASFDVTLCVTVLCHRSIADPVVAVRELARVTRPGGLVCLMEPGVRRLRRAHDRVTHSARRFARADLVQACTGAGLEVRWASGAYAFLVPAAAAKAVWERGTVASDLDEHHDGLRGLLGAVACAERALLRRVALPTGLSVVALAQVPDAGPARR